MVQSFLNFRNRVFSGFKKGILRRIHFDCLVTGTLRDRFGNIIDVRKSHNLITDAGFDFISDVIGNGTQPGEMSHIAIGTGVTAAAVTDTALETELTRLAATYSHTVGTKVFILQALFGQGVGTGAITEAGLLNAAAAGTLLDRTVFAVINKGANDELTEKFEFTMS